MPNAFGYMPAKDFTLCCFIQISCCPAVFSIIQDIRPVFRFFWCSRWQDTFLGRGQTYGHFCRRLASKPSPTNVISLFSFAVFDCLCTLLDNPRRNSDRMHQIPSVFCMGQLGSREGLSLVISLNTQGEVTSQSLWSRYDRHFVGITRHNALS